MQLISSILDMRDDVIKMFIPNASGYVYKTRCETRRGKVLLRKIASSILNCCPRIAFASNLSFAEEEACGANLHVKVALDGGKSKKL